MRELAGARAQARVTRYPRHSRSISLAVPPGATTLAALAAQAGDSNLRHHVPLATSQQADKAHLSPPSPENAGLLPVMTPYAQEGLFEMLQTG